MLNGLRGKELENSLFGVHGKAWKRMTYNYIPCLIISTISVNKCYPRKSISPMFTLSKIKSMFGIMNRRTDHLLGSLDETIKNNDGRINVIE